MTNNAEQVSIENERVDDIPVLLAQLCELRVAELLNECFPTHGNWDGLSFGHLVAVWLTFILSESTHRLSHLQPWAASRVQPLRAALGPWVKCTRIGARNSASSGRGLCGTWGICSCFGCTFVVFMAGD